MGITVDMYWWPGILVDIDYAMEPIFAMLVWVEDKMDSAIARVQ